ncbi:uncharacterized protein LOC116773468 [Danaus plexippus]|uniref:uncharacterized protein LOC116773468 n=1 Tax=Danaus plexippus TaxID=13037 RepID=UPI002AB10555|nr:uncharacterized protein LOC116773468 [Danaus plexippus]
MSYKYYIITINLIIIELIFHTNGCPHMSEDAKAAYKSGEILDQTPVITLDQIKRKLKESEVFDYEDPSINERERKELAKLFEAVEIMTTSRNRQPSSVQNVFSSLRLVERAVKKQLKEGQVSESLASKFHWDKLSTRHRREKPFTMDATNKMRIFNTNA